MAVNKKSNLLECIFISKKSLEISLNLTSQIKQLSLTHFVLIVTEPNLEARSFYSEYRGLLLKTFSFWNNSGTRLVSSSWNLIKGVCKKWVLLFQENLDLLQAGARWLYMAP